MFFSARAWVKQRAFRRHAARSRFLSFRRAVILLQARLRRIIGEAQYYMTLQALYEDWLLRQRYQAARRIQALIRGFNGRVFSARVLQEYRERLRQQFAKQREKLRAKAQARKQAVIHKEVRKVNDVQLMIIISRKDLRSFTRDLSVVVMIYIPECQKYTNFDVSEAQLRDFVKEVMRVKDPTSISIADLYAHHNLKAVLDRRYVVRPCSRQVVETRNLRAIVSQVDRAPVDPTGCKTQDYFIDAGDWPTRQAGAAADAPSVGDVPALLRARDQARRDGQGVRPVHEQGVHAIRTVANRVQFHGKSFVDQPRHRAYR